MSFLDDPAVPHSPLDQHGSLAQVPVFQTNGEWSVALGVGHVVVLPLLQQVQDREEELLLAGVVERGSLVDVDHLDVDVLLGQQSLQYFNLVVGVVVGGLVLLDADKAVEDGGTAVLVETVDADPVLQQFAADFRGVVEVLGH